MRRKDIQLLAEARRGNPAARCEVGYRYLTGNDGFQRHIPTGLEYLAHQSVENLPEVANIIAATLPLQDLVELDQLAALHAAAFAGNASAQFKLGIWRILWRNQYPEGLVLLDFAHRQGYADLSDGLTALRQNPTDQGFIRFLRLTSEPNSFDETKIITLAAQKALLKRDIDAATRCLRLLFESTSVITDETASILFQTVQLAEQMDESMTGFPTSTVQECLERKCGGLDYEAAYFLGRALCGIDCGKVAATSVAATTNFRKGVALLLRAADNGQKSAWLHLFRLHSNHRLSVANLEMARFCLEKAAAAGIVIAQRQLGAAILRESKTLATSEGGLAWLFKASRKGDEIALQLLSSFVLPTSGSNEEADRDILIVNRHAPWLSMRMQLSRDFGLTKLEALSVNPVEGSREWGLVVGPNPFIVQRKVSAPRAIPGLSEDRLIRLGVVSDFFAQLQRDGDVIQGDLRHRMQTQRTLFKRFHLKENRFFAETTSTQLDALRQGPKWASRNRDLLSTAFSAT